MEQDLNGWKFLSKQFKNENHFKKLVTELFGDDFEATNISSNKYLLNCEEFAALFDCLDMEIPLRRQALSFVIKSRCKAGNLTGISEFRQLVCALYADEKRSIPVIDLHLFSAGWSDGENLSDFIRKNSNVTLESALPPQAAVCKVNDAESSQTLQLPCGSLIVIDCENPPAPGELSLSLTPSGSFVLGESAFTSGFLWNAPVLRLHLIPKEI